MACELSVAVSTNMAWPWAYAGLSVQCETPPDIQNDQFIPKRPIHLVAVQMEFEVAAPLSELVSGPCTLALRTADD